MHIINLAFQNMEEITITTDVDHITIIDCEGCLAQSLHADFLQFTRLHVIYLESSGIRLTDQQIRDLLLKNYMKFGKKSYVKENRIYIS